ncbi:MAG: phenylalanine--tRNA ligase subunit alpha [bacterium]
MIEKINQLTEEIKAYPITNLSDLEEFRLTYLIKKGPVNQLFNEFKNVPPEKKKETGQQINKLKQLAQEKYQQNKEALSQSGADINEYDLTATSEPLKLGSRHPISLIKNQMITIFDRLGFSISEGPEIEDDWHVFSALNFPPEHPARDMQDTFFIEMHPDILLRTHTSSVQVRVMESSNPPIRTICPGRVFRNEAISARSHCIFHQIEGLYIDENVSFADLKQTLLHFSKELFGELTEIRLRPSFFPFTEPSAEMDVSCMICSGKGCPVCKYTGWIEILGCGMVDPNVLKSNNINPEQYTGFAFGLGIERIAMNMLGINDIRLFFENDTRFLNQFKSYIA